MKPEKEEEKNTEHFSVGSRTQNFSSALQAISYVSISVENAQMGNT